MGKYHYTECGLDNIWLQNGFSITKTEDGEEYININDIHGLHNVIGLTLITKRGLLFGKEIMFIRRTLDLSQKTLAKILGVNYQTILGWEKNKRSIDKTADHFLKTIFFAYINKDEYSEVYDKINEIVDLDAVYPYTKIEKIRFEGTTKEWRCG